MKALRNFLLRTMYMYTEYTLILGLNTQIQCKRIPKSFSLGRGEKRKKKSGQTKFIGTNREKKS